MKNGKLFVLSGPSGSGKTTIAKNIVSTINNIVFAVSHTTREMREGEINGRDYYFIDIETFSAMRRRGEFAESAEVFGNYYGTTQAEINRAVENGNDVLLEIDVNGANQIRKKYSDSIMIFLMAPDRDELEKRLIERKTDSDEEIKRRLDVGNKEITEVDKYDYIIVNNDLNETLSRIGDIIKTNRNNN